MADEEYVPNPPWVDKALTLDWHEIEARFGLELAPIPITKSGTRKKRYSEYGCGHYGCVLPTPTPGIVFKVTSDPSEAAFVAAALKIGEWPEGIVRYLSVFRTNSTHNGRPVFVLAREEAKNVGDGEFHKWKMSSEGPDIRTKQRAEIRITQYDDWGGIVYDKVLNNANPGRIVAESMKLRDWAEEFVSWEDVDEARWMIGNSERSPRALVQRLGIWNQPARAVAYAARAAWIITETMINEDVGYLIGGALQLYLEHGLILADLHLGNIGRVHRENYSKPVWVITDPGHMVPIDTRWLDIEVPSLG